jgi:hypothetical protein
MSTETTTSVKSLFSKDKKTKKTYIFMCLGADFSAKLRSTIEGFLKAKFPEMPIIQLRQSADISKQALRNIGLIILDEGFGDFNESIRELESLKSKKVKDNVPTLFLTRDSRRVIDVYKQNMKVFQEVDDYIRYENLPVEVLYEKLTRAVRDKNRRKTKRFTLKLKVRFRVLNVPEVFQGVLKDISLHGGLLVADTFDQFHIGDQIHISLPIGRYNNYETGEFVSLSAKVRRIMIDGQNVGISFEHVSDKQLAYLREYLLQEVGKQV